MVYIPHGISTSGMKRAVREAKYETQERSEGTDAPDRERQAREDEIKIHGRNLMQSRFIGNSRNTMNYENQFHNP